MSYERRIAWVCACVAAGVLGAVGCDGGGARVTGAGAVVRSANLEGLRTTFPAFAAELAGASHRGGVGLVRADDGFVGETPRGSLKTRVPGVYGQALRAEARGGRAWVELVPVAGRPAAAVLDDGRVTYPQVAPATDALVVYRPDRVEELLVLAGRDAPRVFTYRVKHADALAPRDEPGGALVFADRAGVGRLRIPAPEARDARGRRLSATQKLAGGMLTISLTLDGDTAFPVALDPGVETVVWTQRRPPAPPARYLHAAAYDTVRSKMLIFGGKDAADTILRDLWEYDSATGSWTNLTPGTLPAKWPEARYGAGMAYDASRQRTVLFGGLGGYSGGVGSSVWEWNASTSTWSEILAGVPSPNVVEGPAFAYFPGISRVLCFGGRTFAGVYSKSIYEWNGSAWTDRTNYSASVWPTPRAYAQMAPASTGAMVVFGGIDSGGTESQELWSWSGSAFSKVTQAGQWPGTRHGQGMTYDTYYSTTLVFGGMSGSATLQDVGEWSLSAWHLYPSAPIPAAWPKSRWGAPLVYDPGRRRAVLFGGRHHPTNGAADLVLQDTIEYSTYTHTWEPRYPDPWPSVREYASVTYDAGQKVVFLFGGMEASSTYRNDVWEWRGGAGTWTDRTPGAIPKSWPTTRSGAIATPMSGGKVILYGGMSAGPVIHQDLWEWTGSTGMWVDRTPAALPLQWPSPRVGPAGAWDSQRGRLVLFGGYELGVGYLDDLWEWDPVAGTWADRTPATRPPSWPAPRYDHAMTYDAERGVTVIFGGTDDTNALSNTLAEWDGTTMVNRTVVSPWPSARGAHGLTYDPGRHRVILFGGEDDAGRPQDAWEWDGAAWANLAPTPLPAVWPLGRSASGWAFDAERGVAVLFGGSAGGTRLRDTWEYLVTNIQDGSPCDARFPDRCTRGYCNDGVCCDAACTDACWTCALAQASAGTCSELPAGAQDPNATVPCTGTNQCDGHGACKKANGVACGADNECASGSCPDGICCGATCATCQACTGAGGTCVDLGQYVDDNVPTGACAGDYTCDGEAGCKLKNGKACLTGQCASGNCVDGYCCSTACTETCKSCGVLGSEGTCSNVPDALPDAPGCPAATSLCDGNGNCKLLDGRSCGADSSLCYNHHCVDGVCCSSSCDQDCWTCNGTSPGTCTPTGAGTHDGSCSGGDPPCDKACTALGECKYADTTVPCNHLTPVCADGMITPADHCSGTGTCAISTAQSCDGYQCLDGESCRTTCGGDQDCFGAYYCLGGSCTAALPLGSPCTLNNQCASGACADNVCCFTACSGLCARCDLVGHEGTCTPIPSGEDPDNECAGTGTCGGVCNGAGGCSFPTTGVSCGTASCASATLHPEPKCDGMGACPTPTPVSCGEYQCSADGTQCRSSCSDDSHCTAGYYCDGVSCVVAQDDGATCTRPRQCGSANCVDGVCCESECTETCKTCALAGQLGACVFVPLGGTDTGCQVNSACDGQGTCKAVGGVDCTGDAQCTTNHCVDGKCCDTTCTTPCMRCDLLGSEGTCTNVPAGQIDDNPTGACSGGHVCASGAACLKTSGQPCNLGTECFTGLCVDGVCCESACGEECKSCAVAGHLGSCTNVLEGGADGACTGNQACDGSGACKLIDGRPCGAGTDCVSGFCVDGVCCNGPCLETCRACNLSGSVGSCTQIPTGTPSPADCGTGPCGGTCGVAGACQYPTLGTACSVSSCANGVLQPAGSCDGAGTCVAATTVSCAPHVCTGDGTACATTCANDSECDSSAYCEGGDCFPALASGESCVRNRQCQSGSCADGVCCSSACSGNCERCDEPGHLGECRAAAAGTDPRLRCQAAQGGDPACAGACDGAGQCEFPDLGTRCGTCAACDGTGRCTAVPPDDPACGAIDCSGLDTPCRAYQDVVAGRCVALATCRQPNDPEACTQWTDLPCADGGGAAAAGPGPDRAAAASRPPLPPRRKRSPETVDKLPDWRHFSPTLSAPWTAAEGRWSAVYQHRDEGRHGKVRVFLR